MKFINTIILTLMVSFSVSAQQRLSAPQLTVKEPNFARMSDAKVSWTSVEGADSYCIRLNGEEIDVIGNTLYLAGMVGNHTVEVIARSSSGVEESLPAVATINVRDYGDGTVKSPYLIYDKNDWNLFSKAVTQNQFSNNCFEGDVVALACNIDFGGDTITPVGKNYATGFRGVFDGKGRTFRNAVLEGKGSLGIFISFHGVMKNFKADNITVKSTVSKSTEGRCAVICGGEATGQFYNCMVTNCSIWVGGEGEVGTLAGTVASVLKSPSALVDRCISMNNTVSVGHSYASALVARVTAGTVRNCIAQNNHIYSGVRSTSGIAALVCGPHSVVDHCSSSSNRITSLKSDAAGVTAEISSGLVVNCTSDNNEITVEEGHSAGGVASMIRKQGNLINCLSKNCTLNVRRAKEPNAGLVFAKADRGLSGIIANCLVLSGSVNVFSDACGFIGIVGGNLANQYSCSDCYYNERLVTEYNKTKAGRFYAFGTFGSGGTNYDSAIPIKKAALESISYDYLNSGVSRLTAFGAVEWVRGADGYPSIK